LIFINNPKRGRQENGRGQGKGQNQFRVQEVQRGTLEVRAGRMVRQVHSPENRRGSEPGELAKENRKGRSTEKTRWLTWNIQDKLAQTDRKHRFKYPGIMGKMGDTWRGWRQAQR
jgi:hypothetical protein